MNKTKKRLSESHKEAIRKGNTGKVFTAEHRENISKAKRGKTIPALSEVKKGIVPLCTYTRRKYNGANNPFYGKKHKQEVIEKLKNDPRVRHRGADHPKWKGGVSYRARVLYNKDGYYAWREKVYKRDNYICQLCGYSKGKILNAHHIIPVSLCLERNLLNMIFDENNGIALCESCHIKLHRLIRSIKADKIHFKANILKYL